MDSQEFVFEPEPDAVAEVEEEEEEEIEDSSLPTLGDTQSQQPASPQHLHRLDLCFKNSAQPFSVHVAFNASGVEATPKMREAILQARMIHGCWWVPRAHSSRQRLSSLQFAEQVTVSGWMTGWEGATGHGSQQLCAYPSKRALRRHRCRGGREAVNVLHVLHVAHGGGWQVSCALGCGGIGCSFMCMSNLAGLRAHACSRAVWHQQKGLKTMSLACLSTCLPAIPCSAPSANAEQHAHPAR